MTEWTNRGPLSGQFHIIALAVLASLFSAVLPALAAPPSYSMTHLGSFGGNTFGASINNNGEVVGIASITALPADPDYRAFHSNSTNLTRLVGGATDSIATSINNSGTLTGISPYLPVVYHVPTNAVTPIGTFDSWFLPASINDSGLVVGFGALSQTQAIAIIYDGTGLFDLGGLGGGSSLAFAINNTNQAVGLSTTASGAEHAFLFDGVSPVLHDLGTLSGLAGDYSAAYAINNQGQITGESQIAQSTLRHAFIGNGATMTDLGALWAGGGSYGNAINSAGAVVGAADTQAGAKHAFLHDGTAMYDLNDLIDPADPYKGKIVLQEAAGINDNGAILANGCWVPPISQHCFAFVLKPKAAPLAFKIEPSDLSLGVRQDLTGSVNEGGVGDLTSLHGPIVTPSPQPPIASQQGGSISISGASGNVTLTTLSAPKPTGGDIFVAPQP